MNEEKVTSETITFASQEFGNIRVLDIDGQFGFGVQRFDKCTKKSCR